MAKLPTEAVDVLIIWAGPVGSTLESELHRYLGERLLPTVAAAA